MADNTSSLNSSPVVAIASSGMAQLKRLAEFEGKRGLKITTVTFNGSNFLSWSKAITMALSSRGRLGFIDGSIPDQIYAEWSMNNHLVMSWLFNSIEQSLHDLFNFAESAKEIWDSIKELYSHQENLYRIFEEKHS